MKSESYALKPTWKRIGEIMTYSAPLGSPISNTRMRTPDCLSVFSGMCSVCTMSCSGTCEIGLSAVRGSEAIYPYAMDVNQYASEKKYPLDYSHLNINGRVFGAFGCEADSDIASYPLVNIEWSLGKEEPIKLKAPIILPAMAKLNWKDYFAGAAMAGVIAVIGEDVVAKDKQLVLTNGKVASSPLLSEMVNAFKAYDRGYGDIMVQANVDDETLGVLEYAIGSLDVKSVELKFGQAAKGIQGISRIKTLEEAQRLHSLGYLVFPDPTDIEVVENYKIGKCKTFEKVGRLPMWDEVHLIQRVAALKKLGAKRVCFKTGPYDGRDLIAILKIAALAGVDLVTFDGAGGGTGNSPVKMMNEWGIPTLELECMVYDILEHLKLNGFDVPQVAITGGIAMEDQVFKALALGLPHIEFVGIGRAAMAAAMTGKQIGDLIESGNIPKALEPYGTKVEDIFEDCKMLRLEYGDQVKHMSAGAIGLFSYLERLSTGLRQMMALNRKFNLAEITREDVVPLTDMAQQVTGLMTYSERLKNELAKSNQVVSNWEV